MVHKHCFISGCTTGIDAESGPATFFHPPKESFEKWREVISKEGFGLSSRLCWRHFDEEDISKGKLIGDKFYPRRWRLKKDVNPKHFLNLDKTANKLNSCFVPSCKVKHTRGKGFFKPPKNEEIRKLWERAIGRTDKKLTDECKVCQNHFAAGDIVKAMVLLVGNQIEVHPSKKWRLKRGTVPSIFPESPPITDMCRSSHDTTNEPHIRDPSSVDEPINKNAALKADESHIPIRLSEQIQFNLSAQEASTTKNVSVVDNFIIIHTTEEPADDDSIQMILECDMMDMDPKTANLPDASWSWNSSISHVSSDKPKKANGLTCLKIDIHSDEIKVIKALQIDHSQRLSYVVLGRFVRPRSFPFEFDSVAELTKILALFEAVPLCPGVTDHDLLERVVSHVSGVKTSSAWFAVTCCGLVESTLSKVVSVCDSCCTFRTVLRRHLEMKGTSKSILIAQKARETEMDKIVAFGDV